MYLPTRETTVQNYLIGLLFSSVIPCFTKKLLRDVLLKFWVHFLCDRFSLMVGSVSQSSRFCSSLWVVLVTPLGIGITSLKFYTFNIYIYILYKKRCLLLGIYLDGTLNDHFHLFFPNNMTFLYILFLFGKDLK